MSDDRAERIQRLREGRRGSDDDAETDAAADDAETDAAADDAETDAAVDDAETTADTTATAVDDAETTTDTAAAATTDTSDSATDLDDEVAAAIDEIDTSDVEDPSVADPDESDSLVSSTGVEENGEDTAETETTDDETVSVLEFVLGDERYCLDITFIEQIVEQGTVTRIPNAPDFVDGVIDLRGDITTVIDPMETLAADSDGDGDLIIVFDSTRMDDEWSVGWAVDGVRRVSTVSLSEVKDSPVDEPWINGVVKRDDDGEFVIWTEPGELMREGDGEP